MTNILLFGRQEIDTLAVKPEGERLRRLHVEDHVSMKPAGTIRAKKSITTSKEPLEQRIKEVYEKSFIGKDGKKREKFVELFDSTNYGMWHVHSRSIDEFTGSCPGAREVILSSSLGSDITFPYFWHLTSFSGSYISARNAVPMPLMLVYTTVCG